MASQNNPPLETHEFEIFFETEEGVRARDLGRLLAWLDDISQTANAAWEPFRLELVEAHSGSLRLRFAGWSAAALLGVGHVADVIQIGDFAMNIVERVRRSAEDPTARAIAELMLNNDVRSMTLTLADGRTFVMNRDDIPAVVEARARSARPIWAVDRLPIAVGKFQPSQGYWLFFAEDGRRVAFEESSFLHEVIPDRSFYRVAWSGTDRHTPDGIPIGMIDDLRFLPQSEVGGNRELVRGRLSATRNGTFFDDESGRRFRVRHIEGNIPEGITLARLTPVNASDDDDALPLVDIVFP